MISMFRSLLNIVCTYKMAGFTSRLVLFACVTGTVFAGGERSHSEILESRLRAVLSEIVKQSAAPGGVSAVVLPDGETFAVAAGYADLSSRQLMKPETRMLGGSTGKSFVGALTLKLARDGVIALDQPISRWLGEKPWFKRLPNAKDITVRDLAMHTSGLPDHLFLASYQNAVGSGEFVLPERLEPEKFIAFVLDEKPLFPAGQGFQYTDTGYLLLGLLIESATGSSYFSELRKQFLDPLSLTLTSPSDHRRLPGLSTGYVSNEFFTGLLGGKSTMKSPGVMAYNPVVEWTGGGLITNVVDLARWAKLLYEGQAMSGDYVADLLGGAKVLAEAQTRAYGLGQGIRATSQGLVYGHSGWIPGYVSFFAYYPEHGFSIAAQFNTTTDSQSATGPGALAKKRLPAVVIEYMKTPSS